MERFNDLTMEVVTEPGVPYDRRENPIVELTFKFSLRMIEFCEQLDSNKQYNLSRQLFRSATSIGANVKEAQNAESRADLYSQNEDQFKRSRGNRILVAIEPEFKKLPGHRGRIEPANVNQKNSSKNYSNIKI